ncbi:hypothetical protein GcM3_051026 [Golovinomyces cichoracearum]|uniref:Uncharacterized protein n=1 Tax=Golovinomyces cichoracearum TaxID=62708 RepID=A0A420IZB3_9PEZI|nr:hypothetical protein GcM3_051026 [Golovinomyces cichoracearum]
MFADQALATTIDTNSAGQDSSQLQSRRTEDVRERRHF